MNENCIALIDQLIAERHRQGKTQRQVAQDAGLTQSVIGRLESKKAMPQLDTLLKVTAALGCSLTIISEQN
ncbi:MAG: helix-turn-helix transcriptional regulator [Clostridia bacterium]|nr:helix-turn-helix transcriptional regulator [Clostridia bacterium]